jgi:cholesterol transport system auxiliary component
LDERICFRKNSAELGFYSDRRWTEIPEEYMRRALERELFERRGVQRVIVGTAPTLDVEVTAFEELRSGSTQARLALRLSLRNEGLALLEDSVEIVQPVEGESHADAEQALTMAFAAALAEAAQTVADRVVVHLIALNAKPIAIEEVTPAPGE